MQCLFISCFLIIRRECWRSRSSSVCSWTCSTISPGSSSERSVTNQPWGLLLFLCFVFLPLTNEQQQETGSNTRVNVPSGQMVVEHSHMSGEVFNLYLHQNYLDFFSDMDDVVQASKYQSDADLLVSRWMVSLLWPFLFSFLCVTFVCW